VLDVCFELAGQVAKSMAGAITIVDEVHGFKFFDMRDLLVRRRHREPGRPDAVSASQIGAEDRISPAAAMCTCRSTYTTWRLGRRSRSPSRSG
jgi:hypothetical protein